MKLNTLNYAQFEGQPKQWRLIDLSLGDVNLLVGKNASGKSRTLNVIMGLAKLLSPTTKLVYSSGNYNVVFDNDGQRLNYILHYEQNKIVSERFVVDGTELLERGVGGAGKIWAVKINDSMEFQAPEDQLAAVVRQDAIQHSFLAPLQHWAQSLYHYPFGTPLGQDRFAIFVKDPNVPFDPKDSGNVVAIFKRGLKEYGESFKQSIMQDMDRIGYPLNDIGVQAPSSVTIAGPFLGSVVGLFVQEKALAGVTDQVDMSQGMFRALSVIIQITYAQMSNTTSSILIDDIGEGLDFERSCELIRLLIDKATQSKVQLIIATNDRFVMNTVRLESWSVLQRSGGDSRVFNYANSKAKFDEFKFTGMNNFDFFATDFLAEGDQQ
jgi:energy-coupling factor transporter ATP-binding protein EcfA2